MVQLAGDGPAVLIHQDGVDAVGEEIQAVRKKFFDEPAVHGKRTYRNTGVVCLIHAGEQHLLYYRIADISLQPERNGKINRTEKNCRDAGYGQDCRKVFNAGRGFDQGNDDGFTVCLFIVFRSAGPIAVGPDTGAGASDSIRCKPAQCDSLCSLFGRVDIRYDDTGGTHIQRFFDQGRIQTGNTRPHGKARSFTGTNQVNESLGSEGSVFEINCCESKPRVCGCFQKLRRGRLYKRSDRGRGIGQKLREGDHTIIPPKERINRF